MMTAMATTKKKSTRAPAKAARERSAFAQAGEEARREAQRKLLLRTLRETGWNITRTAEALGMGAAPAVTRALKDLAPEEYAAAKADGRITNYRRDD